MQRHTVTVTHCNSGVQKSSGIEECPLERHRYIQKNDVTQNCSNYFGRCKVSSGELALSGETIWILFTVLFESNGNLINIATTAFSSWQPTVQKQQTIRTEVNLKFKFWTTDFLKWTAWTTSFVRLPAAGASDECTQRWSPMKLFSWNIHHETRCEPIRVHQIECFDAKLSKRIPFARSVRKCMRESVIRWTTRNSVTNRHPNRPIWLGKPF